MPARWVQLDLEMAELLKGLPEGYVEDILDRINMDGSMEHDVLLRYLKGHIRQYRRENKL